ncbi:MAG: hypothetical protein ABIQ95_16845 [Bdellovibrionia bacterium]
MRNNRGAFAALTVLGGYVVWRNRFAIQRRLESFGVKTPVMDLDMGEAARSIASKVSGRMEHGATIAENMVNKGSDNLANKRVG